MRKPFAKFFADRGTHLAAMIAYFALLSFVPLTFLALSLLGIAGRPDERSFLITELSRAFPNASVEDIVTTVTRIQDHSRELGIVGGVFLAWSSLSLYSVLESAFNIVYGRPNRSFLRGKALAVVVLLGSLVTLFLGLISGSIGYDVLRRFAPGVIGNGYVAYTLSVLVSLTSLFAFLVSAYYFLTNERLSVAEVVPGALIAAVALEASFQTLPVYLRLANNATAVKAFAGPALLLLWLYVMANVTVFGAEINYWLAGRGRQPDEVPGLA
jgi:YihY family inner membrane protein